MTLRMRVPPGTRLKPSASRALASLTASNTSANASSSHPINPLTIQHAPPTYPNSPLTPSLPTTPTPGLSLTYTSFPFPLSQPLLDPLPTRPSRRGFHTTRQRRAKKGAEGRDEISTESTEYSKSGTDAQSAAQQDAAFQPGRSRPEEELEKAGEGQDGQNNPLDVSPANQDISRPSEDADAGVAKGGKEGGKASGGGSPGKAGRVPKSGS